MSLINDEMRAAIGSLLGQTRSYPICASDLRRWRIAINWPEPPRDLDDPYAPHEFNPFAWGAAEPAPSRGDHGGDMATGLERRLGVQPPAVTTVLNGGVSTAYGDARMQVGDVISATTSLHSYEEKAGGRGPLLLTQTKTQWTNQNDRMVKVFTMTILRF